MIIGGMQACSLCDYPMRVATVVFTQGCNFRCPFCHNASLLSMTPPTPAINEIDLLSCLQARHTLIDAVVVSGGEPTLHDDLPEFLEKLRALDLAIKLDTNGSRPAMLRELLQAKVVDFIAMDIKAPWEKYDALSGVRAPRDAIRASIACLAQSGIPHEFRTTMVRTFLSEEDIMTIRAMLPPGSTYRTQPFRAAPMPDSHFSHAPPKS